MREYCCVLNPMSYTPLCQCVTFSKMDDHNTVFIPSLYIHHPFSLSRLTEKDISFSAMVLLFPSGNQKERPFSDFITSSKSCSTNWTSQDSTPLESFEGKTEDLEMRNSHEQWAENTVILTFVNFWVHHYSTNSNWAGTFLFIFGDLRSKSRYIRISELCSSKTCYC